MLGLGAGRCRGADAPSPHAGVYEKERGLVPGKTKSEEDEDVAVSREAAQDLLPILRGLTWPDFEVRADGPTLPVNSLPPPD